MFSVKEYTKFRKDYKFEMPKLIEKDGCIFMGNNLIEDTEKKYAEGETWVNVGYNFKNSISRVLSNLYPMEFKFRGKKVKSIESVLQGIKYKNKKTQNLVLNYSSLDAYHTRACNELDFWGNDGTLYWQGKPMRRNEEEYQLFLDEIYVSILNNPLYVRALMATGDKYILHHIGRENKEETVLTRFEYESRLNSLREFIKQKNARLD